MDTKNGNKDLHANYPHYCRRDRKPCMKINLSFLHEAISNLFTLLNLVFAAWLLVFILQNESWWSMIECLQFLDISSTDMDGFVVLSVLAAVSSILLWFCSPVVQVPLCKWVNTGFAADLV